MNLKFTSVVTLLIVVILVTGFSIKKQPESNNDYDYLRERLENTKKYTIDVLSTMPDSSYSFKPNQDIRSFKELGYHVIYSIEWNIELMKGTPVKWVSEGEDQLSKKELISYGDKQFDRLLTFLKDAKETPMLTDKIIDVLNHNAHHRGQMVTYLRLKNISPPKYR